MILVRMAESRNSPNIARKVDGCSAFVVGGLLEKMEVCWLSYQACINLFLIHLK